jgi:hypothetical protein
MASAVGRGDGDRSRELVDITPLWRKVAKEADRCRVVLESRSVVADRPLSKA